MKMICTTDVVDPDSGEVLQWEGRTLNDDEAKLAWEWATEYPMAFAITTEPDIVLVGQLDA